jgi:hypothetical protein
MLEFPNIVLGFPNIVLGFLNIVLGFPNIVLGFLNIVLGFPNIAIENPNIVLGFLNTIFGLSIAIITDVCRGGFRRLVDGKTVNPSAKPAPTASAIAPRRSYTSLAQMGLGRWA